MNPSQSFKFDRMLATAPRGELDTYPTLAFSNVSVEMTPEIETGISKRWPQDESEPIVASYRGPDRLKRFLLVMPEEVVEKLCVLTHPFWIDGWTKNYKEFPTRWSWRPPFYHRAKGRQDPDYPWFHWMFVAKVESPGLLVTVDSPRVAQIDPDNTIEMPSGSGFYLTKEGPPSVF